MNMVRILFWVCLAIVWIGVCNCGWFFWLASRPARGAIMYLMGAGCFGAPMIFAAIFAIGLVLVDRTAFKKWERWLGWLAGVLVLAIYGVGFWLFGY